MILFEISQEFQDILDYVLIVLVNVIVAPQICASLYIFIRTIKLKIASRKQAKVNAEPDEDVKFEGKILILPEIVEENKSDSLIFISPLKNSNLLSEKLFVSPNQSFLQENNSITSIGVMEEFKVEVKPE